MKPLSESATQRWALVLKTDIWCTFETERNFSRPCACAEEQSKYFCNCVPFSSEELYCYATERRFSLLIRGTDAHSKGCWIGLQDRLGTGEFTWISPLAVGGTDMDNGMFLDWRRDEPNNHSISEGVPAQGGERCAALVPWQEDPLVLEQGSWNDDSCTVSRPFVCQTFGDTQRFALTVTHSLLLTAGTLEGGVLVSGSGTAELLNFEVERGGRIEMPSVTGQPTASFACVLGTVLLEDGASLVLHNNAITVSNAYIGETRNVSAMTHHSSSSYLAMQPFVQIDAGSTVTMGAYCPTNNSPSGCTATNSNVTINARAFVEGILDVDVFTEVSFLQVLSGEMSSFIVSSPYRI